MPSSDMFPLPTTRATANIAIVPTTTSTNFAEMRNKKLKIKFEKVLNGRRECETCSDDAEASYCQGGESQRGFCGETKIER